MTRATPRTFLTGASGYIGLHLLRELLQAGQSVTVAVRAREKLGPLARHPGLHVVDADLEVATDFATWVDGHDCCIHGAFIWGEPGSEFEVKDASVTVKLFDACGAAGVKRCIFLSSVAVHRPFAGRMHEDDPIRTADYYGATKAASEVFMRGACAVHGMAGVVVRPGLVVGPPAFDGASFRSDRRVARMVAEAMSSAPVAVPDEPARQFTDVSALVRIVRKLTELESPRATYVCVDRDVIDWETVADMVVRNTGSMGPVLRRPERSAMEPPCFDTGRVEELEGRALDARQALQAHIRCLMAARPPDKRC
jgi:nucleoside-diphosphate-sugar epimerase